MSKPTPRWPSAFALARTSNSVSAEVVVNDVRQLCPAMSVEQAQAFLDRHSRTIGELMLIAALQGMQQILDSGGEYD